MNELDFETLLEIHEQVIEDSGGENGVLDDNVLRASLSNIYQVVFDTELYPSIEEKAARICYSLATTQGFVDGNKRTAVAAMNYLLVIDGHYLKCSEDSLIELGYGIAKNKMSYEDVLNWVKNH